MSDPQMFTPEEAAAWLRISKRQIYRLIATGELRSVKIGKLRRVTLTALLEFVERSQAAPA